MSESETTPSFESSSFPDVLFDQAISRALRRTPRIEDEFHITNRFANGHVVAWEYIKRDWSQGRGAWAGPIESLSGRYADGALLDGMNPGYLFLGAAGAQATGPDPTGNLEGVHWANIFGTLIWGVGSGNDVSLIKETSATDSTPTAITGAGTAGRPGASIISLNPAVLASADKRLIMGRAGSAALVVGDASGTIDATMHADTATLRGAIETSLPVDTSVFSGGGFVVLLYIGGNNTISALATTSTATDQPNNSATYGSTGIPDGGFALGEYRLSGGPARAFFAIPDEETANGALRFGSEVKMQLNSFALDGKDRQVHRFDSMPLGFLQCTYAEHATFGGGFLASDGEHVIFFNGEVELDTNIFSTVFERVHEDTIPDRTTSTIYRCRGFVVDVGQWMALVEAIDSGASDETRLSLWRYNWDSGFWNIFSDITDIGTDGAVKTVLAAGSHPVSFNTKFAHYYPVDLGSWIRNSTRNPHENFYFTQADALAGYTTYGFIWSPRLTLPAGLEGHPSVISHIGMTGAASASSEKVTVDVLYSSGLDTYSEGSGASGSGPRTSDVRTTVAFDSAFYQRRNSYTRYFPDNTEEFEELLFRVQLQGPGSPTDTTPVVRSLRFRGLTFLDDEVRPPRTFYGDRPE